MMVSLMTDEKKFQEYDNVETLYYHDVVICSNEQAKCRILCDLKINLGTKTCLKQCKVDTGADGNLLPVSVYKCLGGNVHELDKSVDRSSLQQHQDKAVQFKTKQLEVMFSVADQTTMLIGLSDSIRLGLIIFNCFDSLNSVSSDEDEVNNQNNNDYFTGKTDMKCQDKLASDNFKTVILNEYNELFSGIGKLDDEINITLKASAVPYVAPV